MGARFEELDWCDSPIGVISLRRRHEPVTGREVYEVKIDDEFLMSSLFTVVEIELARLGLARVDGADLSVLVGGLGLGYTARAVLEDPRVRSLEVVEAVAPVIDWHRRDLLPDTVGLAADPRCELVEDDFFAMVAERRAGRRHDAVLLDVDHSPRNVLHPSHEAFYTPDGLGRLADLLVPDGVFGLWSDDPPDAAFEADLAATFRDTETHVVSFPNPLTRAESASTVYVARSPLAP
ncbi:spermine/spermidine synthase domain-containing protein [Nocardioides donggukensis]|uniref:Spermidine synthase n=1 Tax=Nocardioides donggukensis TaxID=2774019 RepID=A0A927Q0G1_9ACTN|nr:spermidine synthase [Nocardioides donggukensis]MBD8868394.1 spermidine synthase [Nocardioides donggukensis]